MDALSPAREKPPPTDGALYIQWAVTNYPWTKHSLTGTPALYSPTCWKHISGAVPAGSFSTKAEAVGRTLRERFVQQWHRLRNYRVLLRVKIPPDQGLWSLAIGWYTMKCSSCYRRFETYVQEHRRWDDGCPAENSATSCGLGRDGTHTRSRDLSLFSVLEYEKQVSSRMLPSEKADEAHSDSSGFIQKACLPPRFVSPMKIVYGRQLSCTATPDLKQRLPFSVLMCREQACSQMLAFENADI